MSILSQAQCSVTSESGGHHGQGSCFSLPSECKAYRPYTSTYINMQQGSRTQRPSFLLLSHRILPMERPLYTLPSRAEGLPRHVSGDVLVMDTENFPGNSSESPTSSTNANYIGFTLQNSIEAVLATLICAWSLLPLLSNRVPAYCFPHPPSHNLTLPNPPSPTLTQLLPLDQAFLVWD